MVIQGDKVKQFEEKSQLSTGIINGGFFMFNKKIFDYLTPDEGCDFEFGPLQKLASEGELRVYKHDGFWQCMDTYRDYKYLNEIWDKGNPPWKVWTD
jgi:glucose-1-phosphate cytidylyltransferase